jgi:hypothetical protein
MADNCPPIAGIERLQGAQTILLGEMHGTVEMPAFVEQLACHFLAQKKAVTVAVELPASWQEAMQQRDGVRLALQQAGWNDYWQDGRTSAAMLQLIERMAGKRNAGADVTLLPFDVEPQAMIDNRDQAMATQLHRVISRQPDRIYLILTGNLHARKARNSHPFAKEPLAILLAEALPARQQLSLLGHYNSGTAWSCLSGGGCGPQPLAAKTSSDRHGIAGFGDVELTAIGYDGAFYLGTISASAPARLP